MISNVLLVIGFIIPGCISLFFFSFFPSIKVYKTGF